MTEMPVRVVMTIIDVLETRTLFLLHVAVKRAAANHIQQLRAAANAQDRDLSAYRMSQKSNLNFVFCGMRLLDISKIGFLSGVTLRLDIFSLNKEKPVHLFHILRQTRRRSFHDRDDHRHYAQADEEFEMQLPDVIDRSVSAAVVRRAETRTTGRVIWSNAEALPRGAHLFRVPGKRREYERYPCQVCSSSRARTSDDL